MKKLILLLILFSTTPSFASTNLYHSTHWYRTMDVGFGTVLDLQQGNSITCAHPCYGNYLTDKEYGSFMFKDTKECLTAENEMVANNGAPYEFIVSNGAVIGVKAAPALNYPQIDEGWYSDGSCKRQIHQSQDKSTLQVYFGDGCLNPDDGKVWIYVAKPTSGEWNFYIKMKDDGTYDSSFGIGIFIDHSVYEGHFKGRYRDLNPVQKP